MQLSFTYTQWVVKFTLCYYEANANHLPRKKHTLENYYDSQKVTFFIINSIWSRVIPH